MRTSAALLLVAVSVAAGSVPGASVGQDPPYEVSWPDAPPLATPFPPPDATPPPLPDPAIDEPFAIGEALYDPGRAAAGVVSLLAKMRIGVASSSAAKGLRLDESEVRTLIALAEDDLRASDDIENLPFGFQDLHRAVSGLLPELTIEELAEKYTAVYQAQPDALAAKVMMGQPLEPETRLTRAQIWLLLMDGFAGPSGADAAYGAADRELPDLPSPNPAWSAAEWREALARLPLVAVSRLIAVEQTPAGTTVRRVAQPAALLSHSTGKPLVAIRAGSLTGQEVTWDVADDSPLRGLGTIGTATGQPTTVAANGTSTFAFKPSAPSTGPGELVEEWTSVSAAMAACPLVSSAYAVPTALCAFIIGDRRVEAPLAFSWRTTEKLRVHIVYRYGLRLSTPIGGVDRLGKDEVDGWIVRRPDDTYAGTMSGKTRAIQDVRGSTKCGLTSMNANQRLHVTGRELPASEQPGTGQGVLSSRRTRDLISYHWGRPRPEPPGGKPRNFWLREPFDRGASWLQEQPADGYVVLEFFPMTFPRDDNGRAISLDPDACLPLIQITDDVQRRRSGSDYFIPFNDAQWTTPRAGYAIGLRRARDYYFEDANNETGEIAGREIDLSVNFGTGTGRPLWTVHVQRPMLAP